ncbi:MAG: HAD family hydrolase [Spirochaetales bacterium]|nr:MAG: HAD family hydrolase [Spirochaetales bacterium]
MRTKFIIFDLDGTLYKSESTFVPAVVKTLKDFGMPVPPREEILPMLRFTAQGYSERLLNSKDPERIESFRKQIRSYELADIPVSGILYPGVTETLEDLHALGYGMAICTNAGYDYLNAVMDKTELGKYFAETFGNDSGKPKSELVRDLLKAAGASPGECVLIGDSDSDQTAAGSHNIAFIEAAWGYGNSSISGAEYRIQYISELRDLLSECL